MKNKEKKNELLKKTYTKFVIQIIIWTIAVPLLFIILAEIINILDFQWVYDISWKMYYLGKRLFYFLTTGLTLFFIIFFIWIVGVFVFLYQLLKKTFSYTEAIFSASNALLDKNVDYIKLPVELEAFESQMNHLKKENEKNERLARENEQKKNDLVVYLAHDLKTPLTSMIGYLSLLEEINDMPTKQREKYIGIALEKSYRLEDLINELFDIARFNSETIVLEKEEIHVRRMLEQLIDDFYPILKEKEKKIELQMTNDILIYADSDKLARVFGNLIKNACFYSTDEQITIQVEQKNNNAHIIFINKGKQISKDKCKRIFEKFYRADTSRTSKTGGSGLGLAISKEIIELHGGKIRVTSDEDYTKFYVELPMKNLK